MGLHLTFNLELTEKQEEENSDEDVEVNVGIVFHPFKDSGSEYFLPSKTNLQTVKSAPRGQST